MKLDLFTILELVIAWSLVIVLIIYAKKKMAQIDKEAGTALGKPVSPRSLTEKELQCYKTFSKKIYGELFAEPCTLTQDYGSEPEVLKRQIFASVLSRGAGIYGYPCTFEISGKEYNLPRKFFYYLQDRRLKKGTPSIGIWEMVDGKWHFRCAIPEVYLK